MTRPGMKSSSLRRWGALGAVLAIVLAGVACGGGDGPRTVTAADYKFENLPETVSVGTQVRLENDSEKEIHELVAFRLPDTEKRPVGDLVKLPQSDLFALVSDPPAMVLLRAPGNAKQINAVGDGTLTQKGRYLVACFIPTGADPAVFLAAAEASGDAPPQVAGGPPHLAQGMYGEITVK